MFPLCAELQGACTYNICKCGSWTKNKDTLCGDVFEKSVMFCLQLHVHEESSSLNLSSTHSHALVAYSSL